MTQQRDHSIKIKVVSIHDKSSAGYLSFDLLQILEAIGDLVRGYVWLVIDMDCVGPPIAPKTVFTFDQFITLARQVDQTIDATIVGLPAAYLASTDLQSLGRIRDFPKEPARIAILAVDSSYFDVITKDPSIADRIRTVFLDVRDQDPRNYF